jgi:hypothetical protein
MLLIPSMPAQVELWMIIVSLTVSVGSDSSSAYSRQPPVWIQSVSPLSNY